MTAAVIALALALGVTIVVLALVIYLAVGAWSQLSNITLVDLDTPVDYMAMPFDDYAAQSMAVVDEINQDDETWLRRIENGWVES